MAKRRSNGEGTIGKVTRSGIEYWRIIITVGIDPLTGKVIRKSLYGKTQKEVKEKLKDFQEKSSKATDTSRLGDFIEYWLWNVKKDTIKKSSFGRFEEILRLYIKPNKRLNEAKIIDLDTLYLQKITNKMLETNTLHEVKNMNDLIRAALNYAIAINKIKLNPVNNIVYPSDFSVKEKKEVFLTLKEQFTLIDGLKGDECEGIILTGLLCGLRRGEAMALTEDDVDLKNKTININKSVGYFWNGEYNSKGKKIYEYIVTVPKTEGSIRTIPLPELLIPVLESTIAKNKCKRERFGSEYYKGKLLFCRDDGFYMDNKKPNRHLKSVLKKLKIDKDLNFHSLRHIFITNCLGENVHVRTVMDWAGHTDIRTTMQIYAEINKEKHTKDYEKIDSLFAPTRAYSKDTI